MTHEEFVDFLDLLNETAKECQGSENRQIIDSASADLALRICDELKIKTDQDVLLFLTSMNLLNAYVKQKDARFGYFFKRDITSLCDELPSLEWPSLLRMDLQKDEKGNVLIVSLGSIQFSFHGVPNSLAIPEKFTQKLEWDGIRKQICALSLFNDVMSSISNSFSGIQSRETVLISEENEPTAKRLEDLALDDRILVDDLSGLKYRLFEDGSCAIVGATFPPSDLAIQEECGGHLVRSILAKAFYRTPTLKTLKIGKNVELIGSYCFAGCTSLKSVSIPSDSKLYSIRWGAFKDCPCSAHIKKPSSLRFENGVAFVTPPVAEPLEDKVVAPNTISAVRVGPSKIFSKNDRYRYVANCLPRTGKIQIDKNCFTTTPHDRRERLTELLRYTDTPLIFTLDEEKNEAWIMASKANDEETIVVPNMVNMDGKSYPVGRVFHHAFDQCKKLRTLIFLDGSVGAIPNRTIDGVSEVYLLGPVAAGRKRDLPLNLTIYLPYGKGEYERKADFNIASQNVSRFSFNHDMSEIMPLIEKYKV